MKILMLGWEFPPKISGGLGVASQELAEALADAGHDISFLLPKKNKTQVSKKVKLIDASALKPDVGFWKKKSTYTESLSEIELGTMLLPYLDPIHFEVAKKQQKQKIVLEDTEESKLLEHIELTGQYEANLGAELLKYALLAVQVAKKQKPEVVHAHDWITFRAACMIKRLLNIPVVLHVHSTEHDRNGVYAQPHVISEERAGFDQADCIISVSGKLKDTIVNAYQVSSGKITVVPNALSLKGATREVTSAPKHIAFVGRLTHQKSPSIFVDLARDLSSKGYDFQYSIIGDGYLRADLENRVMSSNFSNKVTFTGFLDRGEVLKKLGEIDLLVVPSASEPFGLVALEAILKKIPVAAARGIGLGEFIHSLPQVERWDHYSFVQLIERLMTDPAYYQDVVETCFKEAKKLNWKNILNQVEKCYQKAIG
ncbi:MAG: glycosyltransferase family 4 protein [Marinoscillum sp.]